MKAHIPEKVPGANFRSREMLGSCLGMTSQQDLGSISTSNSRISSRMKSGLYGRVWVAEAKR